MGSKYNAATSLELRRIGEHQNIQERRVNARIKDLSKRIKVPNLAQAAKSEQLVAVKNKELAHKSFNAATSLRELRSTKTEE